MKQEFDAHCEQKDCYISSMNGIPEEEKVLDSIWEIRRKRNIFTNEVSKTKQG